MSIDDRVTALESSHATLNKVAAQQLLHNREVDEHLTMLLGTATGQERDIKAMQAEVSSIKERLESIEIQLSMEFAAVHQQFAELRALLTGGNQPKPPEP